jgi:hypothetical protein
VTVGCIVTLFVVMQTTARIRWADHFRRSETDPYRPEGFPADRRL